MPHIPRFGAEQLSKYPHMFPRDIEIWHKFLEIYAADYEGFDYDLKVGSGIDYSWEPDKALRRGAFINSKKRIDAVGYQSDQIVIFEVKPDATASAIGQAVSYSHLYEKEYAPALKCVPAIVTNREVPDTRRLTEQFGVLYFVI
jgi:hypothetical protein